MRFTQCRRWQAGLGLAAAAAIGTIGLAVPASADPIIDPTIDHGYINVVKYEGPGLAAGNGLDGPASGSIVTDPAAELGPGQVRALAGAQFSRQQIQGLDMTTIAGRQAAQRFSDAWAAYIASPRTTAELVTFINGYADPLDTTLDLTLGTAVLGTTGANGAVADWGNDGATDELPLGLYLFIETITPDGHTGSSPFVVSVPITNPAGDAWQKDDGAFDLAAATAQLPDGVTTTAGADDDYYFANVFPKNAIVDFTKVPLDQNAVKVGDPVAFQIDYGIPADPDPTDGDDTPDFDGFRIRDVLPAEVTYAGTTTVQYQAPGSSTWVDVPAADYTVTGTTTIDVTFTPAGLAFLGDNREGKLRVAINTIVNASGVIENEAVVFADKNSMDNDTPTGTTPTTETKFGGIDLRKVGPNGELLAGAEFQVYLDVNHNGALDGTEGSSPVSVTVDAGLDGILGNADDTTQDTWTTVAPDGNVVIDGLRYSGFWNNADHAALPGFGTAGATQPAATDIAATDIWNNYNSYLLVETQAPSGYELQAEAIAFEVNSQAITRMFEVKDNEGNAGFDLPFTGGTGSTLLYAGGLILLVSAGGVGVITRRRHSANS